MTERGFSMGLSTSHGFFCDDTPCYYFETILFAGILDREIAWTCICPEKPRSSRAQAPGCGSAIAAALAREGVAVAITARRLESLKELARKSS